MQLSSKFFNSDWSLLSNLWVIWTFISSCSFMDFSWNFKCFFWQSHSTKRSSLERSSHSFPSASRSFNLGWLKQFLLKGVNSFLYLISSLLLISFLVFNFWINWRTWSRLKFTFIGLFTRSNSFFSWSYLIFLLSHFLSRRFLNFLILIIFDLRLSFLIFLLPEWVLHIFFHKKRQGYFCHSKKLFFDRKTNLIYF